jgi:hypothetical protein
MKSGDKDFNHSKETPLSYEAPALYIWQQSDWPTLRFDTAS